jgi:hypothetical protein
MEAESILTSRPEALRLALLLQVGDLAGSVGLIAEQAGGRWSDERRDLMASYTESLAACVEALGQLETEGVV